MLQGMREAFDGHDAKKLASFYSEDCVVGRFFGPDAHGRGEVQTGLQAEFDAFADVKSAPLRVWAVVDPATGRAGVVLAENAWAGMMTGDYAGFKASHQPAGQVTLRVMHLDDQGLVKELREYADDAGVLLQMMGKKNAPPVPILPSNSLEAHVAKGAPDEEQLAAWARELDETSSKDDVKASVAAMADDADSWTTVEGPATRGKKDLEKRARAWLKAFPDQKWKTTNAWGVDGFAIVEHVMEFGVWAPGSKRTGPPRSVASWHWADVLQPTGDRLVAHDWGFANLMELQQQVGSSLPPGAHLPGGIEKKANVAPAGGPKSDTPPVPNKKK
jgi:ketosteroid isomerase-like protein